jgi:hypothetical protein
MMNTEHEVAHFHITFHSAVIHSSSKRLLPLVLYFELSYLYFMFSSVKRKQSILLKLNPWNRVLEKLLVAQLVKKFPTFYEPKGHKSVPLVPVLSQMNSLHTLISYFFKIHFNITLPSMPRSPKWSLPFSS